ncbi:MAG: hypothetical protein RL681_773 [Candidatus Parcubacteria bacterium]|jgi:hypothetical protein
MKKLFVDREESIAPLVERIISDDDNDLVLVIPKNSELGESVSNFRILKREADAAGKNVLVETVDNAVLALAGKANIEGYHPLFREGHSRSLSDIRPHGEPSDEPPVAHPARRSVDVRITKGGKTKTKIIAEESIIDGGPSDEELAEIAEHDRLIAAADTAETETEKRGTRRFPRIRIPRMRFGRKSTIAIGATLLVLLVGGFVVGRFMSRADVVLAFKTSDGSQTVSVTASKAVAKIQANGMLTLPGELLSQTRNTTQFFPATGKAVVSQKATARMGIYNAYSSEKQTLVATTRFETPDGKIFRLDSGVTIPGAKIQDGKIIPSSIEVAVTADKPGEAYNVGPIPKLTIPGLKGSPKFAGFYGEFKDKATGGAVGERPVPTDADIATARAKVTETLSLTLKSNLLANRPDDMKVLDGASSFTLPRFTVNKTINDEGQFNVFAEGQFRAIAFREGDLKQALLSRAANGRTDLAFRSLEFTFRDVQADLGKGEVSFTVEAKGTIAPRFDEAEFRNSLAGRSLKDARALILSLPDLREAQIDLWPFWIGTVSSNPGHIKVTAN